MKSGKKRTYRITVFFIVIFITIFGLWFWWTDSVSPVNQKNNTPIIFTIEKGEGVKSIAANLEKNELIHSPIAFFLLVKLSGLERQLQAGDYRLKQSMNSSSIAQELTHGIMDVWVTILEGWRIEEIANRLAKDLDIPENEFLKYAVEGYMFPDTYLIPQDATASAIVKIFLENFDKKITKEMKEDIIRSDFSTEETIILASIVEREGVSEKDRPMIAGILINRLKSDMLLQADATLQYMKGYQPYEKSWWGKNIANDDKTIESPYNSYKNYGLPPKPISNPGLSAINSVIYPAKTDYYYYLHDDQGQIHYGKSLEEHNSNIEKFLKH
ncbi:endolytic transglycosylase MltG [Patescibacteria group bacterium]